MIRLSTPASDDLSALRALRRSATRADRSGLAVVHVSGAAAFDVLDRLLPGDLWLRDGELRPTLLLRPDGTILADALIGADDAAFWLFVDGLSERAVLDLLRDALLPGEDVRSVGFAASHAVIAVEGPYAWQALESSGFPGISALPQLALAHVEGDVLVARAGGAGEYGYLALVPETGAAALWDRLTGPTDAVVGPDARARAALESWSFDPHEPGYAGLTPIELQLQSRVSRRKPDAPGMRALAVRRASPDRLRTVGLRGGEDLAPGDILRLDGAPVGRVLATAPWLGATGGRIGAGLLPVALAHPGLELVAAERVHTVSPPFLLNTSLLLRPARRAAPRGSLADPYGV